MQATTGRDVPLVVDLDGTLIKSDLLLETLVQALRRAPWLLPLVPLWLMAGRARLKSELGRRAPVAPELLPYRPEVLALVGEARAQGRQVVLATASDVRLARRVAAHVGGFDEVLASDGERNLKGEAKRAALVARFGERGFDYAGNERADLAVWSSARRAIVVAAPEALGARARRCAPEAISIAERDGGVAAWRHALRLRQWPKNLLVLVALLTAHRLGDLASVVAAGIAFIAFCLVASGIYVANDLLDLHADRLHAEKRRRPFAAGELGLAAGLVAAPLLLAAGLAIALADNSRLAGVLGAYAGLALAYSFALKRIAAVDVFVIAVLFTLRILAGAVAIGVPLSAWLAAMSMLIFLSVALAKRYGEMAARGEGPDDRIPRRGYRPSHARPAAAFGIACGLGAAGVLALYTGSAEASLLYRHPRALLAAAVFFAAWVARLWRATLQRRLREDPLAFALRDPASYALGAAMLVTVWAAT